MSMPKELAKQVVHVLESSPLRDVLCNIAEEVTKQSERLDAYLKSHAEAMADLAERMRKLEDAAAKPRAAKVEK